MIRPHFIADWAFAIQARIRETVEEDYRSDLGRWPLLSSFKCTAYRATDNYWLLVIKDRGPTTAVPTVSSGNAPTPWPIEVPALPDDAGREVLWSARARVFEAFGVRKRDAAIFIRATEEPSLKADWISWDEGERSFHITQIGAAMYQQREWLYGFDRQDGFTLQPPYRFLADQCTAFFIDNPTYQKNVFLMTTFDTSEPALVDLDVELRHVLRQMDLNPVRADDKMYMPDRNLWNNVCVYMLCCAQGIAVLEDRARDEFNPNVALEYGFMRGLGKPALLLTESGFRNLRADIIGTLREPFNLFDLPGTVKPSVERWTREIGIGRHSGPSQ